MITRILEHLENFLFSEKSFHIFSLFILSYNLIGLIFLYAPVNVDYWEHLAAIESFSRSLFHPENPYISSNEPTHLFTPYHFFWGAVSGLIKLHPFYLMPLIGTLNILIFFISCRMLAKSVFEDKKYSLIISLVFLFMWERPWPWSGFYNFGQLPLTSTYPYWCAMSLSIMFIAYCYDSQNKNFASLIFSTLIVSIVFLIHPLTGSFLILSLAIIAFTPSKILLKYRLFLIGSILISVLLSFCWPFFPVLKTIIGSGSFQEVGFAGKDEFFYKKLITRISPSLIGLVFIYHSIKTKRLNFVFLGLLSFSLIYSANYLFFSNRLISRYIIFVVFFLHLATVSAFKAYRNTKFKHIILSAIIIILIITTPREIGKSFHRIGFFKDKNISDSDKRMSMNYFKQFSDYSRFLNTADVVLATMNDSWILPAVTGCKVVGVLHPNPFLYDFFTRKKATIDFFEGELSLTEKNNILKKYNVSHLLIPKKYIHKFQALLTDLEYLFQDSENMLYRVPK